MTEDTVMARRFTEWFGLQHREADAPCLLDGDRRFLSKLCRRCGYWRHAATRMPRYSWCPEPDRKP